MSEQGSKGENELQQQQVESAFQRQAAAAKWYREAVESARPDRKMPKDELAHLTREQIAERAARQREIAHAREEFDAADEKLRELADLASQNGDTESTPES